MMDLESIIVLIERVSFPILACGFMFYQINKLTEIIKDLSVTLSKIDERIETLERRELYNE